MSDFRLYKKDFSQEKYDTLRKNIPDGYTLTNFGDYYDYEEIIETEEDIKFNLRISREHECFPIINRGQLWYQTLTETQKLELQQWYNDWLNVTDTKIIPQKPNWI